MLEWRGGNSEEVESVGIQLAESFCAAARRSWATTLTPAAACLPPSGWLPLLWAALPGRC